MELELKQQSLIEYSPVYLTLINREETYESIVPDSMPDVSRIVSVTGNAFVKEKEISDGNLCISGIAELTMLYIPDEGKVPCALHVSVPFQVEKDAPEFKKEAAVQVGIMLSSADARIINPRKVLLRCEMMCDLCVFVSLSRNMTFDVLEPEGHYIEKKHEKHDVHIIHEVAEKTFFFSDVLRQSASKPPMEEILYCRAEQGTIEGKVIGKKLVCKGDIRLIVLYRSGEELMCSQFELPYSQVIELMGEYEESSAELLPVLKSAEAKLSAGELEVSVEAVLQCRIRSAVHQEILCDMYATTGVLDTERAMYSVCTSCEEQSKKEQVRSFCESGIPAGQVLDCALGARSCNVIIKENAQEYTVSFQVDILYLSEDNALCCVSYQIPVSTEVPANADTRIDWHWKTLGDNTAVPVTGGLEVRFGVEFRWVSEQRTHLPCILNAQLDAMPDFGNDKPSVILRRVHTEDSLWSIAKTFGAAVKDICMVNHISGDSVPEGTVLLIPVRK